MWVDAAASRKDRPSAAVHPRLPGTVLLGHEPSAGSRDPRPTTSACALERWMYARLAAAVRRFDEKFGWSWIGACLSVAIITAAAFVLYRTLRGINFHEVVQAIRETAPRDVAIAAGFVAAAYFTLTFYDLF